MDDQWRTHAARMGAIGPVWTRSGVVVGVR
jgi:hypothetical protein